MKNKSLVIGCCLFLLTATSYSAHSAPVLWVGDSAGNLGTVDAGTGKVNVIGNMGVQMTDIAFDPTGNLYGTTFNSLYQINKSTAAISLIGNLGTSVNSLVSNNAGVLYAANSSLFTVNPTTGMANLVGNGGTSYSSSGDLAFVGGNLFLSSLGATGGDNLIKLDTANGHGTLVGNIGYSSVFGLASPDGVNLFGLSGTEVLSINPQTGRGAAILDYEWHGLGVANGSAFISEALTPVPIPATVWLFGSGLLALLGLRKAKALSIG